MTEQQKPVEADPEISQEFFIRVNDFIEMANRIERRFDTQHAQVAMLHAYARYAAHHYLTVVKTDSAAERDTFAHYTADVLRSFTLHYINDLRQLPPAADTAAE